jgi:hypothetical protein
MSRIQELSINQTSDGPSAWMVAGGDDFKTSGREVQRVIKITGTFDGGESISLEIDFNDDDPAPIVDETGAVKTFTAESAFEVLMSPEMRLRTNLVGATAGTSITILGY